MRWLSFISCTASQSIAARQYTEFALKPLLQVPAGHCSIEEGKHYCKILFISTSWLQNLRRCCCKTEFILMVSGAFLVLLFPRQPNRNLQSLVLAFKGRHWCCFALMHSYSSELYCFQKSWYSLY